MRENHSTDTFTLKKQVNKKSNIQVHFLAEFEWGNTTNPSDLEGIPSTKETIHAERQELHSSHFIQPGFERNRNLDDMFTY